MLTRANTMTNGVNHDEGMGFIQSVDGQVPNIISGVCEFCGVNAVVCTHSEEFKTRGMLLNVRNKKLEEAMTADYEGLPRVLAGKCEMCGRSALSEECCCYAARKAKAMELFSEEDLNEVRPMNHDEATIAAEKIATEVAESGEAVEVELTEEKPGEVTEEEVAADNAEAVEEIDLGEEDEEEVEE